jgi:BirA family biotin operon repressor/biotin-[acetyl-CoA-carboxylase] ligase
VTLDPRPADLTRALEAAADRLGAYGRLRYRAEIGSTNDAAIALALAGEPAGTSVVAEVQHAGRGRRGRDWFSPAGAGLYLSVLVRPRGRAAGTPLITLAAGVAVAQAIRAVAGLPVELKWPNDVVIGRPWRKLGGVLCEGVGAGPRLDAVVIGVGLNLRRAVYPPALAARATSLEVELGRAIDRAPLVVEVLAAIRTMIELLERGHRDAVCNAWRTLGQAGLAGATVRWDGEGGARQGLARGIDADGALLVERDGRQERVIAGGVEWEGWGA